MSFRKARLNAGKKVSEVMRYMGVSDAAVYQWETGATQPKVSNLLRLARFYGCSVEQLLEPDEKEGR